MAQLSHERSHFMANSKNKFALVEMILFGVGIIFSLAEVILCFVIYKDSLSAQIALIVSYFVSIIIPVIGFIFAQKSYRGGDIKNAKIALAIFIGAAVLSDVLGIIGASGLVLVIGAISTVIEALYLLIVILDCAKPGNKTFHTVFNVVSIIVMILAVLGAIGYVVTLVKNINESADLTVKIYNIVHTTELALTSIFLAALYRTHYLAVKNEK